jgi:hypothetical protein
MSVIAEETKTSPSAVSGEIKVSYSRQTHCFQECDIRGWGEITVDSNVEILIDKLVIP